MCFVCITSLVCMFSGLMIGIGQQRIASPTLLVFLVVCCYSLYKVKVSCSPLPLQLPMITCLLLCFFRSSLDSHSAEILWLHLSILQEMQPLFKLPDFLALKISLPLFCNDPRALSAGVALWLHLLRLDSTPLHVDWLWFSVMVSGCCKEKVFLFSFLGKNIDLFLLSRIKSINYKMHL